MKMLAGYQSRFIVRTLLPTLLTIGLFITSFFIVLIPQFEEIVHGRKREMIRELTNSAWSVLEQWHQQEMDGTISRERARQSAIRQIERLRYGEDSKDYFWITDHVPIMIMHPYRPDLNGKSLVEFRDSFGKRMFVEMVEAVRHAGEGYVDYTWQWKDDSSRVVPKLSFVRGFEPWGWIIGTGIYLEDVKIEIANLERRIIDISIVITILTSSLLLFIAFQNFRAETRRQRAEQELHESRERYRALVETTTEGLIMVLENGEIYCNKTLYAMVGYPEDSLEGQQFSDLFVTLPVAGTFDFEGFKPVPGRESKNEQVETKIRTRSGDILDVLISISPITLLNKDGIVLSVKDISRHKQIEDALDISQEQYHTLTNQLSIGVFRIAPARDGKFLEVNPAAESILGAASRDSLLGSTLLELFDDEHEGSRFFDALFEGGIVRNWIAGIRRLSGPKAVISLSAILLRDREGHPVACDGILEDITEQQRTDRAREKLLSDLQISMMLLNQPVKPYVASYPRCDMQATVAQAARVMTEYGRDAVLVVAQDGREVGIVIDTDIRERILAKHLKLETPLHTAMTAPLVSLPPTASVHDVLQCFSERKISHLVIREVDGETRGIVHARDVQQAFHASYLFFLHRIHSLVTPQELREYYARLLTFVHIVIERGAGISDVTQMTTAISAAFTTRIVSRAIEELGLPPVAFAFVGLGSDGRKEQTLLTDQDNAIVYDDPAPADGGEVQAYFLRLGEKICAGLDSVGYHYCKGGIMAMNAKWCQPLAVWKQYFTTWVMSAAPQDLLDSKIFFDFRMLHGDERMIQVLQSHLNTLLRGNDRFFFHLSESVLRWDVPEGAQKLKSPFDVKKVVMPIVDAARLYALKHRVVSTNTMERLAQLYENNGFSKKWYQSITQSYAFLMNKRFRHQAALIAENCSPSNDIDPEECSESELLMLKKAVAQIEALKEKLSLDFRGISNR